MHRHAYSMEIIELRKVREGHVARGLQLQGAGLHFIPTTCMA